MRYSYLLILVATAITSCQKESDDLPEEPQLPLPGELLLKTLAVAYGDTVTANYSYDGNKKLFIEKVKGGPPGNTVIFESRYYRNSTGIITKIVKVNPKRLPSSYDSVTVMVKYDQSSSRYLSMASDNVVVGSTMRDSVVFNYNASGQTINTELYRKNSNPGSSYSIFKRTKFTYNAEGNIHKVDSFTVNPSTMAETAICQIRLTYDTKKNSFSNPEEALITSYAGTKSNNNVTKFEFIDLSGSIGSYTIDYAMIYNSDNKPVSAVTNYSPGAYVNNLTFHYNQ